MPNRQHFASLHLFNVLLLFFIIVITLFQTHAAQVCSSFDTPDPPGSLCSTESTCCESSTGLIRNSYSTLMASVKQYCPNATSKPNPCSNSNACGATTGCKVSCNFLCLTSINIPNGAYCLTKNDDNGIYGNCNEGICDPMPAGWRYTCNSQCNCASGSIQGTYLIKSALCRSTQTNLNLGQNNCTSTALAPLASSGDVCTCPQWKCLKSTVSTTNTGTMLNPDQFTECNAALVPSLPSDYAAVCGNGDPTFKPTAVGAQCYNDYWHPKILCISPEGVIVDSSRCGHLSRPRFTTTPRCSVTTGCTNAFYLCSTSNIPGLIGSSYEPCTQTDLSSQFIQTCAYSLPLPSIESSFTDIKTCQGTQSRYVYCVKSTQVYDKVLNDATLNNIAFLNSNNECTDLLLPPPSTTRPCDDRCTYQWGCTAQLSLPDSTTSAQISTCASYETTGSALWYQYLLQFSCLDDLVATSDGKRSVGCYASIRSQLSSDKWANDQYLVRATSSTPCSSTSASPSTTQKCPTNGLWLCKNNDASYSEACDSSTIQSRCIDLQNPGAKCTLTAKAKDLPFECRIDITTVSDRFCINPVVREQTCILDQSCIFEWRALHPNIISPQSLSPAELLSQTFAFTLPVDSILQYRYISPPEGDTPSTRLNSANYVSSQQYLHNPTHPLWSQCSATNSQNTGCGIGTQSTTILCINISLSLISETYTAASPISTSTSTTTRCPTSQIPLYNTIPCVTTQNCPGTGYYCAQIPELTLTESTLLQKYLLLESNASPTDFSTDILSSFTSPEITIIQNLHHKINIRLFQQCIDTLVIPPTTLQPQPLSTQPIFPLYDNNIIAYNSECIGSCTDLSTVPASISNGQKSRQMLCLSPIIAVIPPISQQITTPSSITVYLDNPTSILEPFTNSNQSIHPLFSNNPVESPICQYIIGYDRTTYASKAAYIGPLSATTLSQPIPGSPSYHSDIIPIASPFISTKCFTLPCTLVCRSFTADTTAHDITTYSKCLQTPASLSLSISNNYPYTLPQKNVEIPITPDNALFSTITFPSFPLNIYNENSPLFPFQSQPYFEQYFYQQFLCHLETRSADRLQQCYDYNINPQTLLLTHYRSSVDIPNFLFIAERGFFNKNGCPNTLTRPGTNGIPGINTDIPTAVQCFSRQFKCQIPQIETQIITDFHTGATSPQSLESYEWDCSQSFLALYNERKDTSFPIINDASISLLPVHPICSYISSLEQYQDVCVNIYIDLECVDQDAPNTKLSYDNCLLSFPSSLSSNTLQCYTESNCICSGTAITPTTFDATLGIQYSYSEFNNGPSCDQTSLLSVTPIKLTAINSELNVTTLTSKKQYELSWKFQGNFQQKAQIFIVSSKSAQTPLIQTIVSTLTSSIALSTTDSNGITTFAFTMPTLSQLPQQITSTTPLFLVLYINSQKFMFSPVALTYASYCNSIGSPNACTNGDICLEYSATCASFIPPTISSSFSLSKLQTTYSNYIDIQTKSNELYTLDLNQFYAGDQIAFSFDFSPQSLPVLMSSSLNTDPSLYIPIYNAYIEIYLLDGILLSRNFIEIQSGTNSRIIVLPNFPNFTAISNSYDNVSIRVVFSYQNAYFNIPSPLTTKQFSHLISSNVTPFTIYPYCSSFINKIGCTNISTTTLNTCSISSLTAHLPSFTPPLSILIATTTLIKSLSLLPTYPITLQTGTTSTSTLIGKGCQIHSQITPTLFFSKISPDIRITNYIMFSDTIYTIDVIYSSDFSKLFELFHNPNILPNTYTSTSILPTPNANPSDKMSITSTIMDTVQIDPQTIETFSQIFERYYPSTFYPKHTLSASLLSSDMPTGALTYLQLPNLTKELVLDNGGVSLGNGLWQFSFSFSPPTASTTQYQSNIRLSVADTSFNNVSTLFEHDWTVEPWCSKQSNFLTCLGQQFNDAHIDGLISICSNDEGKCTVLDPTTIPETTKIPVIPTLPLDLVILQHQAISCDLMMLFLGLPTVIPTFIPQCIDPGTKQCVVLYSSSDGSPFSSIEYPFDGMCICNDGWTGTTCNILSSTLSCPSEPDVISLDFYSTIFSDNDIIPDYIQFSSEKTNLTSIKIDPLDFHDEACRCVSGYSALVFSNLSFTGVTNSAYNAEMAKLFVGIQESVVSSLLYFYSEFTGINSSFITLRPILFPETISDTDKLTKQSIILQFRTNFPCSFQHYSSLDFSLINFDPSFLSPTDPPTVDIQKDFLNYVWWLLLDSLGANLDSMAKNPIEPVPLPPWSPEISPDMILSNSFESSLYYILTFLVDDTNNLSSAPTPVIPASIFNSTLVSRQIQKHLSKILSQSLSPTVIHASPFKTQAISDQVVISQLSFTPCTSPHCGTITLPEQPNQQASNGSSASSTMLIIIIVVSVVGLLILICLTVLIFCCYRNFWCCFSKDKNFTKVDNVVNKSQLKHKRIMPSDGSSEYSKKVQQQIELSRVESSNDRISFSRSQVFNPHSPTASLPIQESKNREHKKSVNEKDAQNIQDKEESSEISVSCRPLNDIFTPPDQYGNPHSPTSYKSGSYLGHAGSYGTLGGVSMSNDADFNSRPIAGSLTDEFGLLITPGLGLMVSPPLPTHRLPVGSTSYSLNSDLISPQRPQAQSLAQQPYYLGSPGLHHQRPPPRRGKRQLANVHQSIIKQAYSIGVKPVPLSIIMPGYSSQFSDLTESFPTSSLNLSNDISASQTISISSMQLAHSPPQLPRQPSLQQRQQSAEHPPVLDKKNSATATYFSLLNHPVFTQQLNYNYSSSGGFLTKSSSFTSAVNQHPSRISTGSKRSRTSNRSNQSKKGTELSTAGIKANIKTPQFDTPTPITNSSQTPPAKRPSVARRLSISVSKKGFTSTTSAATRSRGPSATKRMSTTIGIDFIEPQRPRQKSRHGSISIHKNNTGAFAHLKSDNTSPNPGDSDDEDHNLDFYDDNDEGCIDNYSSDDDNYDEGAILEGEEQDDNDGVIYAGSVSRRISSRTSKASKTSKMSKTSKKPLSNPNDVLINILHTVPDGDEEEDEEPSPNPLLMKHQNVVSGSGGANQHKTFTFSSGVSAYSKSTRRTKMGDSPGLTRTNSNVGSVVSRHSHTSRLSRVSHISRLSKRSGPKAAPEVVAARQKCYKIQQKIMYGMDQPLMMTVRPKKEWQ